MLWINLSWAIVISISEGESIKGKGKGTKGDKERDKHGR